MLIQLLEEGKSAWEPRGFIFPVLRNTRHYLKQLEELNDVRALAYDPLSQYPSGRRPPKPGDVLVEFIHTFRKSAGKIDPLSVPNIGCDGIYAELLWLCQVSGPDVCTTARGNARDPKPTS